MTMLHTVARSATALTVLGFGLLAGTEVATATPVATPVTIVCPLNTGSGSPVCPPLPGTGSAGSASLSGSGTPTCPPLPTPVTGPVVNPLIMCPLDAPAAAPIATAPAMVTQSGAQALQVVQLLESLGVPAGSAALPFGSVLPACLVTPTAGVVCPL